MPKKTKREKLLAQTRRFTASRSSSLQPIADTLPERTAATVSFRFESAQKNPAALISGVPFEIIRKDLVKTIVLSALAIGTELFLAYRWK